MKLQLEYINIKKVAFSSAEEDKTRIDNKVLYINKSELIKKFADLNLKDVDIEIAVTGESCRITHVGDVVQPRVKADDPDATFPGVLGKMAKAGDGITKVLNGVTVMECFQQDVPQHCFVDMSGIGAEYTEYSKTYNIVVSAFPAEGTDKFKYTDSLKTLVLSISRYLAELAIDLDADETETFELKNKPVTVICQGLLM